MSDPTTEPTPPADDFDYSEYAEKPAEAFFAKLAFYVDQAIESKSKVKELEASLKRAQDQLRDVEERQIPELMGSIKQDDIKDSKGRRVQISDKVRASLPKDPDKRAYALNWLDQHGHGGIIKREIVLEFGKDDEAWARKVLANLKRYKKALNLELNREVHHSTLVSFITQMLEAGADIPLEAFQAFKQKVAKISLPKE